MAMAAPERKQRRSWTLSGTEGCVTDDSVPPARTVALQYAVIKSDQRRALVGALQWERIEEYR